MKYLLMALVLTQSAHAATEFQTFQRSVRVGGAEIPVGAVSYLRFAKPKGFRAEAVAEQMRGAMGFDRWERRKVGRSEVFEADWAATGKLVRFYITEEFLHVRYSVAILRKVYSEMTMAEAELLQRELAGETRTKSWSFIPEANAEPGVPSIPSSVGCPTCSVSSMNPAAYSTCVQAIASCQFNQLNAIAGGYAGLMSGATNEWRRSNDLLQKLVDPKAMFVLAAAGAAGAAVGGFATSMALEGLEKGVMALIKAIMMEEREQRIVKRFEEARKAYEELSKTQTRLKALVEGMLRLKNESARTGVSVNDLLGVYSARKASMQAVLAGRMREHDEIAQREQGIPGGCAEQYYASQIGPMRETVQGLTRVIGMLEQAKPHETDVCSTLLRTRRTLVQVENQINQARAHLLNGRQTFLAHETEEYTDSLEAMRDARHPGRYGRKQLREERRELMRADRLLQREAHDERKAFIQECVREGSRGRAACRELADRQRWDDSTSTGYRMASTDRLVGRAVHSRTEHDQRVQRQLAGAQLDPEVFQESQEGWQEWFEELAGELSHERTTGFRQLIAQVSEACPASQD